MDAALERFVVEPVEGEKTWGLRHEVLRPGRPPESVRFQGDSHPLVGHFAVYEPDDDARDDVLAVGTIFPDPPPWDSDLEGAWRIRGMAVKDGFRGQGLGGLVLASLLDHATRNGGTIVWCNAREGALGFYRRGGFTAVGELFDDGIAIHQVMWRTLSA